MPRGAFSKSVSGPSKDPRTSGRQHRTPRTSKQGNSQRNKVSSYFNCKGDHSLNTIPLVGCTVTSTNNSTSLGTLVVSDATQPDRLISGTGQGIDDDHAHNCHPGQLRHDRLPSELLDIDTQAHTSNTTDNNPLDTSDLRKSG